MPSAELSPLARRDLLAATRWIEKDNPRAARGLREAVRRAAEQIGAYPAVGALRPELAETPFRFVVLSGYPYVIVYHSERRPPIIARVVHGARDLPEVLRDL